MWSEYINFVGHGASHFNFTIHIVLSSVSHTVLAKEILPVINVSSEGWKNTQNLKLVLQ